MGRFRLSYPIEQKLRERFHGLIWREVLTKFTVFLSSTGQRKTVNLDPRLRKELSFSVLVNILQKLSNGKMRVVLD